MTMHLLLLGLLGATSGVLAIVASFRIEPLYTWFIRVIPTVRINYVPGIRVLYSARRAVEEEDYEVRIRDGYREELLKIHEILIEEHDFDQQYYPVKLSYTHSTIELDYADRRTQTQSITREELISLLDARISKSIARIAASLGIVAILSFAMLIILAAV